MVPSMGHCLHYTTHPSEGNVDTYFSREWGGGGLAPCMKRIK